MSGEYDHPDTFGQLKTLLDEADEVDGTDGNRIYYLATIPASSVWWPSALATTAARRAAEGRFTRIVVEKPYRPRSRQRARRSTTRCTRPFDEQQIYRIDHYMGKETVQNVLALRFANAIFEPIWNRRYVEQVQVTVAESLGVEHRGGFYETAGALRDIVQNHVMQVLALTLMESPTSSDPDRIRDEKVKLLQRDRHPDSRRGRRQGGARAVHGGDHRRRGGRRLPRGGGRRASTARPRRTSRSVCASRTGAGQGVPIFVRTGKRLPARVTEVALAFHRVPFLLFDQQTSRDLRPNTLILRIQPDEGISLEFGAKVPGERFHVRSVAMDFSYADAFAGAEAADGYERLIHDAMVGDATLFIRSDEVHQAWRIVDPYLKAWSEPGGALHLYPAGTWGPHMADLLVERSGRGVAQPGARPRASGSTRSPPPQ